MSSDEKDRLGDKLRDLERAREDLFFAERDKALLTKLREKEGHPGAAHCPVCAAKLEEVPNGIPGASVCPTGHGAWLAPGAVEALAHKVELPELRLLAQRLSSG